MIKIAVCDDENAVCSEIEKILSEYAQNEGISVDVEVFNTGNGLIKNLEAGEDYGLIFLDIEIGDEKGSDIGNTIRNKLKNNLTEIVYISYYKKYAMSLFESDPLNFLIKPVTYENIYNVMQKYEKLIQIDKKYFEAVTGKYIKKIPLKNIIYFEQDGRYTTVVTDNGNYISHTYLKNIKTESPFLRIHKSIIINTRYAIEYRYNEILMENGDVKPIGRSYQKDLRKLIRSMI